MTGGHADEGRVTRRTTPAWEVTGGAITGHGPGEIRVAVVDAGPGDVVLVHAGEAIAVLERSP